MEIKRPNQERFDMTREENLAFWYIIMPEYSHSVVREKSLLLYLNRLVRNEDAG